MPSPSNKEDAGLVVDQPFLFLLITALPRKYPKHERRA